MKNFARFPFLSEAQGRWWPHVVFRTSLSQALAALTPATSSFILHHLCIALPCAPFLLPWVFKHLCHRVLSLHLPLKLLPSTLSPHCSYLNLSCSVSRGRISPAVSLGAVGSQSCDSVMARPLISQQGDGLGDMGRHGGMVGYCALCCPVNTGVF